MSASDPDTQRAYAEAYRAHQQHLRALCYRLTGSSADAADLVQETFARLMERGPADRERDLRPWLVRVAVNLARDRYRARRRRRYVGPWLPSPVDTEAAPELLSAVAGTEARYAARESASLAFLIALEALSPSERAALVLRDVLDYSAREAGAALGLTEPHVRTLHLRARKRLEAYDRERATAAGDDAQRQALMQLSMALAAGDVAALESILAADVRTRTDGGGAVRAALREVRGRANVARFFLGLTRKQGSEGVAVELREINGAPALLISRTSAPPRWATHTVFTLDVDGAGQVRAIYVMMAPDKLGAV